MTNFKTFAKSMSIAICLACTSMMNAQEMPPLKESVTWKNLNAHNAPLPLIGVLEHGHSSLDKDSWWSVGCETLDRDYSNFENYRQYVGETGVGYARIQSGWAKCEKVKGKYDFEWLDRIVDGLIAEGVKPWICLCYGNPVYSEDGFDLNANIFPEGPIMDGWNRYVAEVVKRYKGKVTMYEVWNEPDGGKNGESYDAYAVLFSNTAKTIRRYDKNVKIAAFGVVSPDKPYIRKSLEKMRELDAVKYIDYITYHVYWTIPEYVRDEVRKLQKTVKEFSGRIELLQGETGCPAALEYGHALKNLEWSEYSQVKWDLRQMAVQFGMGIPSSIFTMVDLNYGWMLQSFGLIRMNMKHVPQYKRPKFYGVQNMANVVTREFTPDSTLSVQSSYGREIECVGLKKNGSQAGVFLWLGGKKPGESLDREAVDLTVEGLSLKDPVYVDMVTGKVYEMAGTMTRRGSNSNGKVRFTGLPLWDAPVLIINRDCIRVSLFN